VAAAANQTIHLASSWLQTCYYDKPSQTLSITTAGGREYTLTGVPPDVFIDFISASSPGQYFNTNLKGVY
jgi:hypothetical protein